jgi:RND family efflux transporter MFP subunit
MKKFFAMLIVLAGIGFLGWQIYQKASVAEKSYSRKRGAAPVAVEIVFIEKATVRNMGRFTGTLYPLSEFIVAPKIAGRLEKILFDIGDTVKAGDLVAVLDDEEYRQQVYQAEAELEVGRANIQERRNMLENAKREYDRTVALRKKKIASESELDTAESEFNAQQARLKVGKAQVAQKEAALKMAKVRLSYAQIRVPQNSGTGYRVVGERFVDEGAMLAPNTPIISVLDISTLVAVINVIERDYPKIRMAQEATIHSDAYPGDQFLGKVVRIAPLLKEKSREARVEIEIPNKNRLLKPGMFVRAQIEFEVHPNATVVPLAALVKRDGKQGVFVADMEEKKARFVPVTPGIVTDTMAEITSPLAARAVVTLGHHLLEDGATILLPVKEPSRPAASDTTEKPGSEKGVKESP